MVNKKNQIEFAGETYSVTGLARKILTEQYGWTENLHVNGWRYFTKDRMTLSDRREQIEAMEAED